MKAALVKVWPCAIALAMTPLVWFLLALLLGAGWWSFSVFLIVPVLVACALPSATWDAQPSPDSNGQRSVVRGDLAAHWYWLETPDERLPGGTYEPTVWAFYTRWGRWLCSLYWLGWRNQLHGLAFRYRRPLAAPWPLDPGSYSNSEGLWWMRKNLPGGWLQYKAGWRQYLIDGVLYGIPCCTITRA
jgi:hypothetical protein